MFFAPTFIIHLFYIISNRSYLAITQDLNCNILICVESDILDDICSFKTETIEMRCFPGPPLPTTFISKVNIWNLLSPVHHFCSISLTLYVGRNILSHQAPGLYIPFNVQ